MTTIDLENGATVIPWQGPRVTIYDLLREYCGKEAADYFDKYAENLELGEPMSDDWERIADGYYGVLVSARNDLQEVLEKKRLNRQRLYEICNDIDSIL